MNSGMLKGLALSTIKDILRGGLRFSLAALRTQIGFSPRVRVRLPTGGHVIVRSGDSDLETVRQVFREREYEIKVPAVVRRVHARYEAILASGHVPVIIDAGANIGAASLWFKQLFPLAAVVAVEPDPANAELARQNLSIHPDVLVMEAAIGGAQGHVDLVPSRQSWAITTERSASGTPIVTIPQAAAGVANGVLFIVKVDIEGFERDLFASNSDWLDDVYLVYIEPHDWMLPGKGSSRHFQREFGKRDFEIFLQGENLVYVRRESDPN
jgi:FkbM family methyltransferase